MRLSVESQSQLEFLNLAETLRFLEQQGLSQAQTLHRLGEFMQWPVLEQVEPSALQLGIFSAQLYPQQLRPALLQAGEPLTFALSNPLNWVCWIYSNAIQKAAGP